MMATALPAPRPTATAPAAPASGTSRHRRRAVARALCLFAASAARFVARASPDGVVRGLDRDGRVRDGADQWLWLGLGRGGAPVRGGQHLDGEGRTCSALGGTVRARGRFRRSDWREAARRLGPDPSWRGQPGARRTGGDLLPSRGRHAAGRLRPDRSSRGQPGRSTDRRGSPPITWAPSGWSACGPTVPRVDSPAARRTGGDLLPSRGRRAAGRMRPDRSSCGRPSARRTGGDLLPSRGRRAARPEKRQQSGRGGHALPRTGRPRPRPVRRSWTAERSQIPAEELEQPAALHRRPRGFGVSQRTRDGGRSALAGGRSTFAGRLSEGQEHRSAVWRRVARALTCAGPSRLFLHLAHLV